MNTDHYEVFITVAKMKNISKAAEALGYTQSGVSHIISRLEKYLGIPLLNRQRDGVSITDKAQALIPYFEAVLYAEKRLLQEAQRKSSPEAPRIKLATIQSVMSFWLPQLLSDFIERDNDFSFEITEKSKYAEIERLITDGTVDCAFSIESDDPNIAFMPLLTDYYCVVMPKGHPLSSFEVIEPAQLTGYQFIIPEEGITNSNLAKLISDMNIRQNLVTDTLDDSFTFSMVEKGWGISIVPRLLGELFATDVEIRMLSGNFSRSIGIITHANSIVRPELRTFLDFTASWFANNVKC